MNSQHAWRCALPFGVLILLLVTLLFTGCFSLIQSEPTAAFSCRPSLSYPYQHVEFDASGCLSEKDVIIQYAWDFDDGTTANGVKVQHAFTVPGDHDVCLTITTEHGKEVSVTHTVHVAEGLVVPTVFPTIQAAIDAAQDGEVVVVLPGTYRERISFKGKAITVQSTDPSDPSIVDATVLRPPDIDCAIVSFVNGETRDSVLAGLTIQGSHKYEVFSGGGIYVREASPTIRNNNIRDLTAFFSGGGIYLFESRAHIVGNRISNNRSQNGGGIETEGYYLFPTIEGNIFVNNRAEVGGAIHLSSTIPMKEPATALPTTVLDNVFNSNVATTSRAGGGAIYIMFDCKLMLDTPDSNTYEGNTPDAIYYEVLPSE